MPPLERAPVRVKLTRPPPTLPSPCSPFPQALDAELRSLVYENYSRFIAATDTIRARKDDLAGLGPAVAKLQGLMGKKGGKG